MIKYYALPTGMKVIHNITGARVKLPAIIVNFTRAKSNNDPENM
jgi:hypothetical protein